MKTKLIDLFTFSLPIILIVGVLLAISDAPKGEATTKHDETKEGISVTIAGETVTVANDNANEVTIDLKPQKLVNGNWVEMEWWDNIVLAPKSGVLRNHFGYYTGVFRYKVVVYTDNHEVKSSFFTEKIIVTNFFTKWSR